MKNKFKIPVEINYFVINFDWRELRRVSFDRMIQYNDSEQNVIEKTNI